MLYGSLYRLSMNYLLLQTVKLGKRRTEREGESKRGEAEGMGEGKRERERRGRRERKREIVYLLWKIMKDRQRSKY
jgi:hypothetical protein